MDKLKNFIDTNREAFEDDLLPEGHFERFEQKLAAPRKSQATLYSLCAFAAAACIALLFLFKLPGGTPLQPQHSSPGRKDAPRQCRLRRARLQWPRSLNVPCWCSPSALKSELLYHEATKKERDKKPPSSFPPEGGSIVQNSAEFTARSCQS